MKKKRISAALAAICLMMTVLFSISAYAAASSDTLRVGVKDYIVNFNKYNEKTGLYYGLEIDLAEKLASELGYKNVEFVRVTPDDCEEMVDSGEIDVLIAAYSLTDLRLSERDFSPSYYEDHAAVMVCRSSLYDDITDLMGKKIGVIHGSSAWFQFGSYFNLIGLIPGTDSDTVNRYFEIVKVDEIEDLYHRLEVGEVDAVVSDRVILNSYFDEDEYYIFDENLSDEDYCVVTRKGSDLSEPVYEAMEKLIENGFVDELKEKWS